jgi:hypothetical protein
MKRLPRIIIENNVRKYAMSAMDNMDTYLNSKNAEKKVRAYSVLKSDISSLKTLTGLDDKVLYDSLSSLDLSNYNLGWLRALMARKLSAETGLPLPEKYKVKKDFF